MFDLIGILARAWLAAAPAPVHARPVQLQAAPLVMTPTAAAAATTATQNAKDAHAVVDKVEAFYKNIKQVTAMFRQTVTNTTFGSTKTSDGKVWLLKPGKMRWDYYESKNGKTRVKKSFISNGSYLYVVEHDNKQVVKKNLQQDLMPVAVSFLYGKGDLNAEFNAALDESGTYGGKDDVVLKLTPKQPSAQYKDLILVVNKHDFHVKDSVIIDSSGNTNHIRFYSPDFESPVEERFFEFDRHSVPNYRIIDADQVKK